MAITDDEELKRIYAETKTIAVVGASGSEEKAAHTIPRYLQRQGYRIIPVNPRGGEILGEKVYETLADVPEQIDVVDVFRTSEETPDVSKAAVAAGAKVLWLQEGISSDEAERIASEGGLQVVMDRCMGATHHRLLKMGQGPGPRD
ncbi:MAG: CoA-binding protein [Actinomycetota bacterium]